MVGVCGGKSRPRPDDAPAAPAEPPRVARQSGCPLHTQSAVTSVSTNWWPNQLNLKPLKSNDPTAGDARPFNYANEFAKLDLEEVKKDITSMLTTSQEWWPADYGHYGPFFIRLAWHSAGTYRIFDGRGGANGGNMRFAPLNSWPDNGNLDKARRLLWPIKQKYGQRLSWGDLMIFVGNCAIESMGLKPFGFAGGRVDIWEPEEDIYWGQERTWLAAERGGLGEGLEKPLGAVQMGLIYVNPEGPGGKPDPLLAAKDIRATFGRMAMGDEETVALIAGGHTFGKGHGAGPPANVGPEPEGATIEEQGFGWANKFRSGKGGDTITSGLEGAWTAKPAQWDNGYFDNLFKYDWKQTKSPAGATLWIPTDPAAATMVPDAHDPGKKHAPIMFTTDLALKLDPVYGPISKRFHENPGEFGDAFGRAWYKLTHRDMGPRSRCLGNMVPPAQLWQDPVPEVAHKLVGAGEIAELKSQIQGSEAKTSPLLRAAWGSAVTYRATDHRGGANGARIALAPQKDWAANDPAELAQVLDGLKGIQARFNEKHAAAGIAISLADLIVLAGSYAVEAAAKAAGHDVTVPFTPGRTDASLENTDVASFAVLEPTADGFRNHLSREVAQFPGASPEALLLDRAHFLTLTAPEMSVLVAGMRAMDANTGGSPLGVLTATPGKLTNDFFVNLLDMSTAWKPTADKNVFEGRSRGSGEVKWRGTRVDLMFGSNSQLRAIAEYYACADSKNKFVHDFVVAWAKVMNLDRSHLAEKKY